MISYKAYKLKSEKIYLTALLKLHEGNVRKSADDAEVETKQLYAMMKRCNIRLGPVTRNGRGTAPRRVIVGRTPCS